MGDSLYPSQMRRYTEHPDRNDLPSLETLNNIWAMSRILCMWLQRRINILLGRPATRHTKILSAMLTELKYKAEEFLREKIHATGFASPHSAHLSPGDINDALRYAGLSLVGSRGSPSGEEEMNAAYGGYGFGLCNLYKDSACEEEEDALPEEHVLHLDYTMATLSANVKWIRTARQTYGTIRFTNWDLGLVRKGTFDDDMLYWAQVRGQIQKLANIARSPYTQLLLTGECARDDKFLTIVKDVLSMVDGKQFKIGQSDVDPQYVIARGVAEFTKRRQEGWLECVQSKKCQNNLKEAGHDPYNVEL